MVPKRGSEILSSRNQEAIQTLLNKPNALVLACIKLSGL